MDTIIKFLNDAKTFYLATTKNGKPDVRPMAIALPYEEKLYFITAKKMDLHSQLQNDANISISACVEDKWVRLYAEAVLDDSEKTKTTFAGLDEKIAQSFPIETMAPYYLKNANASICSFTQEPEVHNF
ncbi:MAG: pyridoxamine 5'-phosphate oxidase family protein [Eubacteriaceae bacterium]